MHTIFDTVGTQYAVARGRLGHQVVYTVHAADELVARVVVDINVLVWPAWRRRGIATAPYRLIEWETGKALRPSRIRSKAGKAFWASRSLP